MPIVSANHDHLVSTFPIGTSPARPAIDARTRSATGGASRMTLARVRGEDRPRPHENHADEEDRFEETHRVCEERRHEQGA